MAIERKPLIHHVRHHLSRAHHHVRDHFIPHERNNYHPHALKHHVLVGYSIILILLKVLVVIAPIALPSSSLYSSAITAENIIDLTNQTRKNLSLVALNTNQLLMEVAQDKANDMMQNQYFAHTSPAGVTPWDWFKKVGYQYLYAGENLAVHFFAAEDVQAGWMASPTHRANIVNENYTEIGVGVANGMFEGVPTTFVVEEFGKPQTAAAATGTAGVVATATTVPATARVASVQTTPLVKTTASAPKVPSAKITTPAPKEPVAAPAAKKEVVAAPPPVEAEPSQQPLPSESDRRLADVSQPLVQKIVQNPVIDEATFTAVPIANGYRVHIGVTNASSVTVRVGQSEAQLVRLGQGDAWEGELQVVSEQFSKSGETLTALAANEDGRTASASLAILAPSADTQKFYIFNEGTDRFTTFLGVFHISNLNDSVKRFYMEFIVFLSAALLVYLFASRFGVRHLSVVGHSMGVLVLAFALVLI